MGTKTSQKVSCHEDQPNKNGSQSTSSEESHQGNCLAHCAHHVAFMVSEIAVVTTVLSLSQNSFYRFNLPSISLEGPFRPPVS